MFHLNIKKELRDFELTVKEKMPLGQINVLLGASGSGKSTLLHCLAGITSFKGSWFVTGKEEKPKVSLVFQNYELFPHLNVYENIRYGLRWQKIDEKQRKENIDFWVSELKLRALIKAKPEELSGGEKQRVALAQSLILNPDLLLLDEPTSSLDKPLKYASMQLIKNLQRKWGFSVLWVTHDFSEALSFADYAFFIDKGNIIEKGLPIELYEKPNTHSLALFTGILNLVNREKELYCRPHHIKVNSHNEGILTCLKYIQKKRMYSLGFFENEDISVYALLKEELIIGKSYYLTWEDHDLFTFAQ